MSEKVNQKYKNLIESYINIKPILSNLYKRNGNHHIDGILNEIRALNDHIARCYRPGITDDQAYEELCKAEGHLKRLIYDSFKQLNIIFYDYADNYEKTYFGAHWISFDNGNFWSEYTRQRQSITQSIEKAKLNESRDSDAAFEDYQMAYVAQETIYAQLNANKKHLERGWFDKMTGIVNSNKYWFLSTVVLAVIPAMIWEIYINNKAIIKWMTDVCIELSHKVGQYLTGI